MLRSAQEFSEGMKKTSAKLTINKTHTFRLRVAQNFVTRFLGWHARSYYDGVWLIPCSSIQTFTVRQWLDVIWLSKQQEVVQLDFMVAPNRVLSCTQAYSAIELPAGTIGVLGKQLVELKVEFNTAL